MRKLILIFAMLFVCNISYAKTHEDVYADDLVMNLCNAIQYETMNNVSKIAKCEFASINLDRNHKLILRGIKNGKCYYTKTEMDDYLHGHTVADCYAPMAVMKSVSNAYTLYSKTMCDNLQSQNKYESLIINKVKSLEQYCKTVQ